MGLVTRRTLSVLCLLFACQVSSSRLSTGTGKKGAAKGSKDTGVLKLAGMAPDPFVLQAPLILAATCKEGVVVIAAHTSTDDDPLLYHSFEAKDNDGDVLEKSAVFCDLPNAYKGPFRINSIDSTGAIMVCTGWRADCDALVSQAKAAARTECILFGDESLGYYSLLARKLAMFLAKCAVSESVRALSCAGFLVAPGDNVGGNGSIFLVDSTGAYRVRALCLGGGRMEGCSLSEEVNKRLLELDFSEQDMSSTLSSLLDLLAGKKDGQKTTLPRSTRLEVSFVDSRFVCPGRCSSSAVVLAQRGALMGYDHTIVSIHAYLRHAGSFVLEANHESFTEKLRGLAQQRYRRKVACLVMISSLAWVPAGVAASTPVKYEMSPAEKELIELMQKQGNLGDLEVEQEQESTKAKAPTKPKVDHHGLPDDLRMDEYSSDEDEEGVTIGNLLVGQSSPTSMEEEEEDSQADQAGEELQNDRSDDSDDDDDLADVPDTREFEPVSVEAVEALGLSHVGTNSATHMGDDDEDDDSDIEDVRIGPDDALVVVAKTEEDFASLEVHCYDTKTGNLYVHHDIPLPAFPLCLAHGQVSSNGTGNFCAVGTFSPGIEIWNLDVLNALEPTCILGGEDTTVADDLMKLQVLGKAASKAKNRNGGQDSLRAGSHSDAVMALSWNSIHKQVLASGSADRTVKLWDVTRTPSKTERCDSATFSHHKGKVQSVSWHPREGTLLATGGYDRSVCLLDARSRGENVKRVRIRADCEAIAWDPFHPEYLTVASEDGTLACWDVRNFDTSKPLWSFVCSEYGGVSDLAYNQQVPGLFATCSIHKTVTLWDTYNRETRQLSNEKPRALTNKDMCSGKLYTVAFYPSSPWLLGCGGSGNQLALWDLSGEESIQQRFAGRAETGEQQTMNNRPQESEGSLDEFNAMMTAPDNRETEKSGQNKKKSQKPKQKKKPHRKGR